MKKALGAILASLKGKEERRFIENILIESTTDQIIEWIPMDMYFVADRRKDLS